MMNPRSHARAAALAAALVASGAGTAWAWGFGGHRMVNRKAIATLPPGLRPLFEANADYVAEHAIDPDLWRAAGVAEGRYGHFLDLDAFGEYPFDIARVEAEHVRKHGAAAEERGRLPWQVEDGYQRLVEAFRAKDPARVLAQAAALGHYAGDAHVPLHAIVNYDGRETGQNGVHDRWESRLLERFERQVEPQLKAPAARRISDRVAFFLDALRGSNRMAAEVLASDLACRGPKDLAETAEDDRYDNRYYSCVFEREQGRLLARLGDSVRVTGSLWLSAWLDAGRPALPDFRFPYVRKQSRAVLISLDGASAPLVDDAVARGVMPHLARLRREGATARGATTALPSKTAVGHAALFTGAWADVSGITGNEVPPPGSSLLHWESGYASTHLRAEPLWVTAARQGLVVSVSGGTQVYPFKPYLEERRFGGHFGRSLTLLDGYHSQEQPDRVLRAADLAVGPVSDGWAHLPAWEGEVREVAFRVGDTPIVGLLHDDPADPKRGFDSLLLATRKDAAGAITLKPLPLRGADASAFGGLIVRSHGLDVGVFLRLFELSPDGRELLLYQSRAQALAASKPLVMSEALEATGGLVGNGAYVLYAEGGLGPTLAQGGDGTAERRYLETAALIVRQATRLVDFAIDRTPWDLLVAYLPHPDEALHVLLGHLDPSLPGHDPALAARVRPFVDEVLRLADGYAGHIRERVGDRVILAVASDHGMVGADRVLRPNVALAQAGLLALKADGTIDLARTRAVCGGAGAVLINKSARDGGIVPPEQEEQVRREVAAALRALRDPESGRPVVTGLLDARDGHDPGIGGPGGGDLYLSLALGYDVSAEAKGAVLEAIPPRGVHFQEPEQREMQSAFAIAGPGVAAGADLGLIRQIDVAPTLAALLGIEPPAQATGAVLQGALARR